jgi:hypothetical protein
VRFNGWLGVRFLAVVTGLTSAVLLAGQGAAASAAPPPVSTTTSSHQEPAGAAGLPDHRRSPGLKALLSEKDSDRAGDPPNISALCQSLLTKPNPYRPTGSNIDQIHQDTVVTVGSQAGCQSAQNENTIAVNPENPKNLVAGTNDYRVFNSREQRNDSSGWAYTTFDGGQTWANVGLPHLTYQTGGVGAFSYMDSAGDPVLAFGPHNTVYYGNIVFSRGTPTGAGTEAASGIAVSVSHDGGLHWDEPTLVRVDGVTSSGTPTATGIFNDKIWLAADPRNGRVYVTWTRFLDDADGGFLESPIVVAASTDYGHTFGGYQRVDAQRAGFAGGLTPYSQGSNPKVGVDGTLYIAYEGEQCPTLACDTFRDVTVVATSHDHGRSFVKSVVGTNYDFPFYEPLGTETLTNENFRINSYPQLAYDPVTQVLAVTWSDDRNGRYNPVTGASIRTNGDNIVSTSTNGKTWSAPKTFGTGADEFFAAVAVYDGVLAVTSYTRHYSPGGINLDYAYWSVRVGSHGPASIRRVTTQGSNPRVQFVGPNDDGDTVQGLFIGDYTGVALGSDHLLHPCWTDFRGRPGLNTPNQDSYTQAISL